MVTGSPPNDLDDLGVGAGLLVLRRGRAPLEEQELGPEQADAAGAEHASRIRLRRRADVREERDLDAVRGHRRQRRLLDVVGSHLRQSGGAPVEVRCGGFIGVEHHLAGRPVDRELVRPLERSQEPGDPDHRGDAVGAGEDGGMGRRRAGLERDPEDVLPGQGRRQRGRQVLPHHDGRGRQQVLLLGEAGHHAGDPLRDVDHVRRPGGEQLVLERGKRRCHLDTRHLDCGQRVVAVVVDTRRGGIDQRWIPGQGRVGHEDARLVLVAGLGSPVGHRHEVVGGLVRGVAENQLLVGLSAGRDTTTGRQDLAAHEGPRSPRHAGCRRHAAQPPLARHRTGLPCTLGTAVAGPAPLSAMRVG